MLGIRAVVSSSHQTTSGLDWKEAPVNMRKQLHHTKFAKQSQTKIFWLLVEILEPVMSLRSKASSLKKRLRKKNERYQQVELKSSHSQKLSQRTNTFLVIRRSPGARKTAYLFPRKKRQSIVNVSRICLQDNIANLQEIHGKKIKRNMIVSGKISVMTSIKIDENSLQTQSVNSKLVNLTTA